MSASYDLKYAEEKYYTFPEAVAAVPELAADPLVKHALVQTRIAEMAIRRRAEELSGEDD